MNKTTLQIICIAVLATFVACALAFFPQLSEVISKNREVSRVLWVASGVAGYLVFRKIRPEFYEHKYAKSLCLLLYVFLGPAILLFSLLALAMDHLSRTKTEA
jgi:hypothetical protein